MNELQITETIARSTTEAVFPERRFSEKVKNAVFDLGLTVNRLTEPLREKGSTEFTGKAVIKGLSRRLFNLTEEEATDVTDTLSHLPALLNDNQTRPELVRAAKRFGEILGTELAGLMASKKINVVEIARSPLESVMKLFNFSTRRQFLATVGVLGAAFYLRDKLNFGKDSKVDVNIASPLITTAVIGLMVGQPQSEGNLQWNRGEQESDEVILPPAHQIDVVGETDLSTSKKITSGISARRKIIGIGCGAALLTCCIGAGGVLYALNKFAPDQMEAFRIFIEQGQSKEKTGATRTLTEQEQIIGGYWEAFKKGPTANPINDINTPLIEGFTAYMGPTWMFGVNDPSYIKEWFGVDLTPTQINVIRDEWVKKHSAIQFINLLENMKSKTSGDEQQKIQRAIDFYKLRVNAASPEDFLDKAKKFFQDLGENVGEILPILTSKQGITATAVLGYLGASASEYNSLTDPSALNRRDFIKVVGGPITKALRWIKEESDKT